MTGLLHSCRLPEWGQWGQWGQWAPSNSLKGSIISLVRLRTDGAVT
jgi:hypothetical protein